MEQLPAWDNTTEYQALNTADYLADIEVVKALISDIENLNKQFSKLLEQNYSFSKPTLIPLLQDIAEKAQKAHMLLSNLSSFVGCESSLDATNSEAIKGEAQMQTLYASLNAVLTPREVFLKQCDEEVLNDYLNSPHTRAEKFIWQSERRMKDFLLSAAEEQTLAQITPYALHGWWQLYYQMSGSLKVEMPSKGIIGASQASGYLRDNDREIRKQAWQGLQTAWKSIETPCAAVLNNIAGYRLEEYKKRSHKRPMHYLEAPLSASRIEKETLDAMLKAIETRVDVPRRALKAMARLLRVEKLEPWDLLAPSPVVDQQSTYSYQDGLNMITEAFGEVSKEMGEFVTMMNDKRWIDARVLPNKGAGAYCTGFAKSRTPRVFQSYMGSMQDVSTLAHELGHAYHSWVMRDIPLEESHYPMTLAETASIFGETVLAEKLYERSSTKGKIAIAWGNALEASGLLVNIPARFEFEKNLYEARAHGPLSATELNEMTDRAWRKWYGDILTQPESQYWMTKQHFNFSGISFYNFPYAFGYLFSLSIYALKDKLGADFSRAYVEILRDTGRMSAEEVIQKHLGADIRDEKFWQSSLDIVEKKVANFEALLSSSL